MKKVLFIIGALCLLFGLSFYCSYGVYKKSTEYTDRAEQAVTTPDVSDERTEASAKSAKETIETITKQNNDSFASDTSNSKPDETYKYLVSSLNGYVAVFTESGSLYEFTDIKLSDLENDVKKRILNGIKFQKEKELFTFLESCSS